jgi:hypothetical protein
MSLIITDKKQKEDGFCCIEFFVKIYLTSNPNELLDNKSLVDHANRNKWGTWINIDNEMYLDLNIGDVFELTKNTPYEPLSR